MRNDRIAARLYWLGIAILLTAWSINLYEALTQPRTDWLHAAWFPTLATIFIALLGLIRVRRRLAADRSKEPSQP